MTGFRQLRVVSGDALARIAVPCWRCDLCGRQHVPTPPVRCGGDCSSIFFTRFHSRDEATRYSQLLIALDTGRINDLSRQVPFSLMAPGKHGPIRVATYIADFVYWTGGKRVIEDVKGEAISEVAKLKLKWMAAQGDPVNCVQIAAA